MLKFRHSLLILISGLVWFAIGLGLLSVGLNLMVDVIRLGGNAEFSQYPVVNLLSPVVGGGENAVCLLIAFGLLSGYMKARFVLSKTVNRTVKRISSLSDPASLFAVYNAPYCMLIVLMICLGMAMRFFGLAGDIRGFVDVTVGTALINGASYYFRSAKMATQKT